MPAGLSIATGLRARPETTAAYTPSVRSPRAIRPDSKASSMSTSTAPERHDPDWPPAERADYQPPRMKYLVAALVTCLAAVGLIILFGGGSNEPEKPAGVDEMAFVDGTLTVVEQTRLVMKPFQPLDGKAEVEFVLRPQDAGNFDIAHLQSHSSVAIPTRIYYRREGDTLYAIYKEDAPVNSQAP